MNYEGEEDSIWTRGLERIAVVEYFWYLFVVRLLYPELNWKHTMDQSKFYRGSKHMVQCDSVPISLRKILNITTHCDNILSTSKLDPLVYNVYI